MHAHVLTASTPLQLVHADLRAVLHPVADTQSGKTSMTMRRVTPGALLESGRKRPFIQNVSNMGQLRICPPKRKKKQTC